MDRYKESSSNFIVDKEKKDWLEYIKDIENDIDIAMFGLAHAKKGLCRAREKILRSMYNKRKTLKVIK